MKIYVCCPANHTTGGPEALHQLAHALRTVGCDAFMAYHPFSPAHTTPAAYAHYGVPAAPPEDAPGNVVVLPETMTGILKEFRAARAVVWWLSIDFYFGRAHKSRAVDAARYVYRLLTRKCVPIRTLRRCHHAAQSEYAAAFLRERGIAPLPLSDYLNAELLHPAARKPRQPTVLYNPKKGMHVTRALIEACPELRFRPLVGLSRRELREVLSESMLYVDFGHHPGKDRMPREAAASGCVVITNRRGSAAFREDVPIPEKYKIDDRGPRFVAQFRTLARAVLQDFDACSAEFEGYVTEIRDQERVFVAQVAALARHLSA